MNLSNIFKKCKLCRCSGLFYNINDDGYCKSCAPSIPTQEKNAINITITPLSPIEKDDPLDSYQRNFVYAKPFYNGCPIVYKYRVIPAKNVDRSVLQEMVSTENFDVNVEINSDGYLSLLREGKRVATLTEYVSICKDWIERNDPFLCEFVEFKAGSEKVALYFYRDEQKRFSNHSSDIAKLTSFMSEDKQETISFTETGEKLYVEEDDNGKFYIRNIDYHPIGNLPAKYSKMYNNGDITAIFFDHYSIEKKDNGDDKYIPFVKIYY